MYTTFYGCKNGYIFERLNDIYENSWQQKNFFCSFPRKFECVRRAIKFNFRVSVAKDKAYCFTTCFIGC